MSTYSFLEKKIFQYPNINETALSFSLFGRTIDVQWYGLSYICGVLVAWYLMLFIVRQPNLWSRSTQPISKNNVDDLITYLILGILIGGRLGYCIFYTPIYYLDNPEKIFFLWEGGMSFHGGFLGVVIAGAFFAFRRNLSILTLGDIIAFSSPPGLFFGRIANFINGELWGRQTSSFWGIAFTKGGGQFCPDNSNIVCLRHPSQLYEATLEGILLLVIFFALVYRFHALKKPGLIFGTFLLGYGLIRFFIEFVREADNFFITETNPLGHAVKITSSLGLTMGQTLCLPMILVGFLMIWNAVHQTTKCT